MFFIYLFCRFGFINLLKFFFFYLKNISTQWSRLINENAISQTKFTDNSSTTHEPPASIKTQQEKQNQRNSKKNKHTHTHTYTIYLQ